MIKHRGQLAPVMLEVTLNQDSNEKEADNVAFGVALSMMKIGFRISRKGWNGKGMFVWMCAPSGIEDHSPIGAQERAPYPMLRCADGSDVPWACSITDMMACDWSAHYPNREVAISARRMRAAALAEDLSFDAGETGVSGKLNQGAILRVKNWHHARPTMVFSGDLWGNGLVKEYDIEMSWDRLTQPSFEDSAERFNLASALSWIDHVDAPKSRWISRDAWRGRDYWMMSRAEASGGLVLIGFGTERGFIPANLKSEDIIADDWYMSSGPNNGDYSKS